MPRIELILSKYENPSDKISLFFDVFETEIAKKYFEALQEVIEEKKAVYEPDRTYNFPGDVRDRHWIARELNRCIDAINEYAPRLIRHRAKPYINQKLMNHLHHYFEKYRGPILHPPKFFVEAPQNIRKALEDFNILIHRFEDYERNEQYVKSGRRPAAKIILTFENRPRYLLEEADFKYFTKRVVFGRWYINYCEVGKPIWDLYQDRDQVIGEENIVPLKYYSADALIEFSQSITEVEASRMVRELEDWWGQNEAFMSNLGFRKGDPRNAIGDIPVADLDRTHKLLKGKNELEILKLIGQYARIEGALTHAEDCRSEVPSEHTKS